MWFFDCSCTAAPRVWHFSAFHLYVYWFMHAFCVLFMMMLPVGIWNIIPSCCHRNKCKVEYIFVYTPLTCITYFGDYTNSFAIYKCAPDCNHFQPFILVWAVLPILMGNGSFLMSGSVLLLLFFSLSFSHCHYLCSVCLHPTKEVLVTTSDDHTWKMWALPRYRHSHNWSCSWLLPMMYNNKGWGEAWKQGYL